jgi:hypothetical protein
MRGNRVIKIEMRPILVSTRAFKAKRCGAQAQIIGMRHIRSQRGQTEAKAKLRDWCSHQNALSIKVLLQMAHGEEKIYMNYIIWLMAAIYLKS